MDGPVVASHPCNEKGVRWGRAQGDPSNRGKVSPALEALPGPAHRDELLQAERALPGDVVLAEHGARPPLRVVAGAQGHRGTRVNRTFLTEIR